MAAPTPKQKKPPSPAPASGRRAAAVSVETPEAVDPIWLIKAVGFTIMAALICGYVTLCLLFYQGQWQFVLHPSTTQAPTDFSGAPYEAVRFGVDDSGTPQLSGLWIPSPTGGKYASYTILYLPSGDGSLADAAPLLANLHTLGINIFAFDYRGFGQSAPVRPNQERMTQDAASAWKYLTASRALPPGKIVPFGSGVAGALALGLAGQNLRVPAVILDTPRADLLQSVLADPRTRLLPVRALFHDRFELAAPLTALKVPKLFLVEEGSALAPIDTVMAAAAAPKMIAALEPAQRNSPIYLEQVARFLDQYLR